MKKNITKTLALIATFLGLNAFGAEMYYNRLSTGEVVVPAGTYGDIVVPPGGYKATKFQAAQTNITEAAGDFGGSFANIIKKVSGDTAIYSHTVSGWFKQNKKSDTYALLFAPISTRSTDHIGYKASMWTSGVLQVGKIKSDMKWRDEEGAHRNSTKSLPVGQWFYFTLAITKSDSARKFTAQAFVNGVALPMQEGEIGGNLNGNDCITILMGDNIECAGLRVDDTAVTDPAIMKAWATDEKYVVRAYTYEMPYYSMGYDMTNTSSGAFMTLDNQPAFMGLNTLDDLAGLDFFGYFTGKNTDANERGVRMARNVKQYKPNGTLENILFSVNTKGGTYAKAMVVLLTNGTYGVDAKIPTNGARYKKSGAITTEFAAFNDDGTVALKESKGTVVTSDTAEGYALRGLTAAQFFTTDPVLAFKGITVHDIRNYRFTGITVGGSIVSTLAEDYNPTVTESENGVVKCLRTEFQIIDGDYLKCVIVEFSNGEGGVYVKVLAARYTGKAQGLGYKFVNQDGSYNGTSRTIARDYSSSEQYGIHAIKALPPATEYAATVSTTEPTDITALTWTPRKPACGFESSANLTITATANATITIPDGFVANTIAFVSEANTIAVTKDAAATVTIGGFDFSEVLGKSTLGFDPGAATIAAGTETELTAVGTGAITIGAEKQLTVTASGIKKSLVTNNGTLKFVGGTAEAPIGFQNDVSGQGIGTIVLANETYVKCTETSGDRAYNVTGAGPGSSIEVTRGNNAAVGFASGSTFRSLTFISNPGGDMLWVNEGTFDETVDLVLKTGGMRPHGTLTVRSLEGSGAISDYNGCTINIVCGKAATYSGASDEPFVIGGTAVQTISGNYTGALTVNADAKVVLGGNAKPSSITNNGTVEYLSGSTCYLGAARSIPQGYILNEGVKVEATQTAAEFGTGKAVEITGLADGTSVKLNKLDGTSETVEATGGKVTFSAGLPKIDGAATLFDCTFTNLTDVGKKTGTFSYKAVSGAVLKYDTAAAFYKTDPDVEKERGVYIRKHPYISDAAPTINGLSEFTAVLVGKMSATANTIFVYFGSSKYDSSNEYQGLMIATTADKDGVAIFSTKTSKNARSITLVQKLTVPNSATARHVYVITKRDVAATVNEDAHSVFTIYLDGVKRAEVKSEGIFTLGRNDHCGVQVGADYGGGIRGYNFGEQGTYVAVSDVATEEGVLNVMRIYDYTLTQKQVTALTTEYPYESQGGLYTRTVSGEVDYAETATWAKNPSTTPEYDVPTGTEQFSPSATIAAGAAATVTVNTNSVIDIFTCNGEAMTFVKGAEDTDKISVGTAVVNAPITNDYGALDLSQAALSLGEGGAVTFDLKNFPIDQYFSTTKVQMTGLTEKSDAITIANVPASTGRLVSFDFEGGVYCLNITVDASIPFVYTIDEGAETGAWTWGDDTLDEATVLALPSATIKKAGTGTQQFVGASKFNYVVDAGTLMFTNNVSEITSTITINEGGTFDMHGNDTGSHYDIVLNGGTLANYGATIPFNKRQIRSITLTKDSFVAAVSGENPNNGSFCFVSNGYATNTLNLAGHTLTKNGDAQFLLVNTVVTNGTVVVEAGQLRINAPNTTENHTVFTNATLTIKKDAELYVGRNSLTIGAITGEGGTIEVESARTLSPFTLNGSLKLTGNGNYGTITMAENAVADVGTRHNLTFAGKGTVDVKLTAAEYQPGKVITAFTRAQDATTTVGKVFDPDGKDVTYQAKIDGNTITMRKEATNGTIYYFTLKDAIEQQTGAATIEMVVDVTDEQTITVGQTIALEGGTNILENVTFSGSGSLTLNTGCIGIAHSGNTTAGGCCRFSEDATNSWAAYVPSGYKVATLSGDVRPNYSYEFVPAAFVPDPTKDEVLIPVADGKGNDAGAIKLDSKWVADKTGETDPQKQAEALNTQEDNGMMKWQNDILGLTGAESTSKPVVATPQQTAPVGYIDFKMGGCNVDTTSGATVKYKVLTAATPGAEVWSQTGGISNYTETVRVELPDSGVKYYKLEVIPETSESVKEETKAPQVTINGKGYPSLAAAIGDAEAGDTLVVLGDLETGAGVNVAKDMTIDMNELTVAGMLNVKSGATLTVCGVGEFDGPITVEDGGKLDFKNGKHIS